MAEVRKKPFWVECGKCKHQWAAAYLPMEVSLFAKASKATCPMCGNGPKGILIAKQSDGVLTEPEGGGDPSPMVLFIDEFDALSRQRRRGEQASDDSRNEEVNTLLQRIEQFPGFMIAATNFAEHIDQAIWRRFDIHIELDLPGQEERERILARYLEPYGLPARPLAELGRAFETASPALMRQFCENLKRQIIIGPKLNSDMRKEPTIERLLVSVSPHPDLGKPRLWSHLSKDDAVKVMPWPLPLASDAKDDLEQTPPADNVIPMGRAAS